jgi:hypothetical protein
LGWLLEQEFQETIGRQPETLAHHYSQAGLVDLAIELWGRAGARSAGRSAHHEAVGHFGSALDLVGKLPPSHQRDERELELTLALAVSLIAVHGFGSIRVEECAVRAKGLSDKSTTGIADPEVVHWLGANRPVVLRQPESYNPRTGRAWVGHRHAG